MTLWEYLKSKMQNNLGQVVCENHAEMTYEELIVFAEEYAKKLKGIKCCAILCNCEMAASVALLSCLDVYKRQVSNIAERNKYMKSQKILYAVAAMLFCVSC